MLCLYLSSAEDWREDVGQQLQTEIRITYERLLDLLMGLDGLETREIVFSPCHIQSYGMPNDHSHNDVQEEQMHFANVITTFRNYATYSVGTQYLLHDASSLLKCSVKSGRRKP